MADKEKKAKEPTAEQKLLEIIESKPQEGDKGADKGGADAGPAKPAVKKRGSPVFSMDVLKGRGSYLQEALKGKIGGKAIGIDTVNQLLVVCIVGMFIYLAADMTVRSRKVKSFPDFGRAVKEAAQETFEVPMLEERTFYTGRLERRDFFKPLPEEKPEEAATAAVPVYTIGQMAENLRLAGVSWLGEEADNYAMIEDLKTETTHFLKEGDLIAGLTVRRILKGKVVLEHGGEQIELK